MTESTFSSAVSTKPSPRLSAIYWKRCAWRSRLPHSWPWLTSNLSKLAFLFLFCEISIQLQKSRDRKKELSNQSLVSSVLAKASVFLQVHRHQSTYDLVSSWLLRFIHFPQLNSPVSKNGRATLLQQLLPQWLHFLPSTPARLQPLPCQSHHVQSRPPPESIGFLWQQR